MFNISPFSLPLPHLDPGIFTGILHDLGVKGLEVEELWGLDPDLLKQLEPVHALVFLFKWVGGSTEKMDGSFVEPDGNHYFASVSFLFSLKSTKLTSFALSVLLLNWDCFSHQVINNACASIALLNATLNIQNPNVELGEELTNLQSFSTG